MRRPTMMTLMPIQNFLVSFMLQGYRKVMAFPM
jgi:hypothetical protein